MAHTLEDIARISGYSRSTVSRVINGEYGVSEKAKQKINEVVEKLNYQPNHAARALAAGKMMTIGLLIPESIRFIFTDPYFQYLSLAISQACEQKDYSLILWLTEPEFERKSIQRHLKAGIVDGFIAASAEFEEPLIEALHNNNKPFVIIGRQEIENGVNFVDADNKAGGYLATQHLIERGYQRITTITGPQDMAAGRDRLTGYERALHDNGIERKEELIVQGDFTRESGYHGARQLLTTKPDAIFVASDYMAFGAIQAINEAGLSIPDDIAIVGFDDIPQAAIQTPSLTTVHQPIEEMGKQAVEIVINAIDHPEAEIQHVILPPTLVQRQSS